MRDRQRQVRGKTAARIDHRTGTERRQHWLVVRALAAIGDIRDEEQIRTTVAKAVETFGGIDALVNNASAISLTPTEKQKANASI